MAPSSVTLNNGIISADILLDWGYDRSRYDRSATVGQVMLNGHTFLSREKDASGGVGLGGVGLTNVFEWEDTSLYERAAVGDNFPLLGVGLLRKSDTSPFMFARDYAVTPFERIVDASESRVSVRTLPHACFDAAADITKTYTLEGSSLVVSFNIRSTGRVAIRAHEFCHNFFQFDGHTVDSSYRVSFPYSVEVKARRGQVLVERDAYRPGELDLPTASSAFWVKGWEGLQSHWMKIENDETGTAVLVEDDFPVCGFYSWNCSDAICPEVFAPIVLAPGQAVCYTRKYTFLEV